MRSRFRGRGGARGVVRRAAPSFCLAGLALANTACVASWLAPTLRVPAYTVSGSTPGTALRVGAGHRDITPPPGFPTGGHGPAGSLARGHWGRLQVRAFYFEDARGERVALVSLDLFAVPGGLRAKVAQLTGLPPESILLAATHTHQGPGNFLTVESYNQYGSAESGFSLPLFDQLASRTAGAIGEARAAAVPASLEVRSGPIAGSYGESFLRNRSPRVFLLNRDRDEILEALRLGPIPSCEALRGPDERGEAAEEWDLPGCPRAAAVDPNLTVLSAYREDGSPLARLVFFAVHPTVLDHEAPLYSPDLAGVAMERIERDCGSCVAGFFNGAEGDVVAARGRRDLGEVRRIGERLATGIERVLLSGTRRVSASPALVDVRRDGRRPSTVERFCETKERAVFELAQEPLFGAAAFGGGEGDRTALFPLGWREGVRAVRPEHHQGDKLGALDSRLVPFLELTKLFGPPSKFPASLPITWITLGPIALAGVPVELSTAQGFRIHRELRLPHGEMEIVGLADEYSSYGATPEEYVAQDYMGASTIWGPEEGPFFSCALARLRDEVPPARTRASGEVGPARFRPGPRRSEAFGPEHGGDRRSLPDEVLEKVLVDDRGLPERHLPWFSWEENGSSADSGESDWAGMERKVAVTDLDGHVVARDTSFDLLVVLLEARPRTCGTCEGVRTYAALWLDRRAREGAFRFHVTPRGGRRVCSTPFSPSDRRAWETGVPVEPHGCEHAASAGAARGLVPVPPGR